MTPILIYAIAFSIIFVIILVSIFLLYLGGKTDTGGFILMYAILFFILMLAAGCFAEHIKEVNSKPQVEVTQ